MSQIRFASLVSSVVLVLSFASILALSSASFAQVQPPQVEWEKTYGGTGWDEARSAQQTADGGYVVAGQTDSFGAESGDVYLVKTNSLGNKVWQKTYGGTGIDSGQSVQQTSDGGYIVAGFTDSFGAGGGDVYLIKTDANGNVFPGWPKTFGGAELEWGNSVQQTSDGGYVVAGTVGFEGSCCAGGDIYLVKTDIAGDLEWQKTFGGLGRDFGNSVRQTMDGGYIVAGSTGSFGPGENGSYLVKTDSQGDLVWQKMFGGSNFASGSSVQQTVDQGYIVTGYGKSFGAGSIDVYLVKTDSLGNLVWQKTFGEAGQNRGYSVQQTTDGYIVGCFGSFGVGSGYVYLVKTNSQGDLVWQKTIGGEDYREGFSSQQTTDGGYIVAGLTVSGAKDFVSDVFLIKLTPEIPPVPLPPLPPQGLSVEYDSGFSIATLEWQHTDASVTSYRIERRVGFCQDWRQIWEMTGDPFFTTRFADLNVPQGERVCYRLKAVNPAGVSEPSDPVCVETTLQRWQLKLYVPGLTPNDQGTWEDLKPCDPRFQPDRGTAVIVHGWNPDRLPSLNQYAWTLEVAKAIATTKRLEEGANILAWDWLLEAEGGASTDPIDRANRAYAQVADQAQKFADASRLVLPVGYVDPIHLMGYSYGGHLVAQAGILLTTADEVRGITALPVRHVTLWDPPTRVLLGAGHPIKDDVGRLRRRDVYVDVFSGLLETGNATANEWVDVPDTVLLPEGHAVFNWYLTTIPVGTDPRLFTPQDTPYPGDNPTIGFGTSALLDEQARRPNDGCHPGLGTLMFGHPVGWRGQRSRDFKLTGYQCILPGPSIPQQTQSLDRGSFGGDCDPSSGVNQSPTRIALGIGATGAGAGGQAGAGELVASFSLELTIDPIWDELSFQYDFTAAPVEAILALNPTVDGERQPLWQMSSGPTLDDGLLDSGLFTITQLQGKEVILGFSLSSTQPGAQVVIQELTFWQSPTHGNRPPVANAGPDQTIPADANGFATVTLDGSTTTDSDDDALLYLWELDGEFLTDGVQPGVELREGRHLITLVVRDPADHISIDEVVVTVTGEPLFVRADSNSNGDVDISDPINTLGFLFTSAGIVTCQDAADANDDGTVDISDAIFTLGFLFLGAPSTIPEPYPNRDLDPTEDLLGCD